MDKTPDTITNELFNSLDVKTPYMPDSDSASTHSMVESNKNHKSHAKSKKSKKHKKKYKKYKKRKCHSHSISPDSHIELKLKKDKLEEVKSGMPVTLDVVMETIVTTANEKIAEIKNNSCENNNIDKKESQEDSYLLKNNPNQTSNTL